MEAPLSLTMTIWIALGQIEGAEKGLRLPAGRAVADGNGLDLETAAAAPEPCLAASRVPFSDRRG